jgi:hypothetical protein
MPASRRPTVIPRAQLQASVSLRRAGLEAVANAKLFDIGGSLEGGASDHISSGIASNTSMIQV